jgi:hypothetical protein
LEHTAKRERSAEAQFHVRANDAKSSVLFVSSASLRRRQG